MTGTIGTTGVGAPCRLEYILENTSCSCSERVRFEARGEKKVGRKAAPSITASCSPSALYNKAKSGQG